ncbi:sensor histidine kinase [Streptomyces sp. RLB1-33]|uniref:sensor histidine kinase n=1 Tax=Streptomyces mirabilis TaxID=68239 RepID=UPI00143ED149|nr:MULTISPECIES: HAMP domain-containing sensor histidine kinase [Streptomyces]QIY74477.1 HAMP domain-containing histidine kinase [Streptomyces sp. RLB1-33]QUW78385.1 HAMP domain-containing histidine kinase [Streptomyces mirabilis]
MTRRIALSVLALITAVLVLAVVPLGLIMTQREQTSFRDEAAARTRSIASAAEEYLSDHKPDAAARSLVEEAQARGDCATVYDSAGHVLMSTACSDVAGGDSAGLASSVLARPDTLVRQDDQWLTTAVPIGDASGPVGVAVLSRSADPLHDRILAMWGWLALIGVSGLGAAVLMSVLLARWVGRPLRVLDQAAQRLGEGALDARAPVEAGPQEVRRLAATFNTMAGRTEALVHGHRAVVADVSHQLRTPLAALRLRLDLLAADAEGDTAAELADAQGEIARLSRLVDGLLAVARAEHAVPRPVPVGVDRLVAERVAAWEPVAHAGPVRLTADCCPGLTAFLGEGDLEQVLDNLIANALDAVQEGGQVRITGKRQGGAVQLRVVDNGPGMVQAARESAFRRFGNPEASGTGLGLAIVHRLVTANGGTAELLDSPGGGLTVALSLPASRRGRDRTGKPGSGDTRTSGA